MLQSFDRMHLDLSTRPKYEYLNVHQYDKNSRLLYIQVTDDGKPVTLSPIAKAMIKCRKADGKQILNDCQINDNIITVELTEQMLVADGPAECEVVLYEGWMDDNGKVMGSAIASQHFKLNVEKSVHDSSQIESLPEYTTLTNALVKSEVLFTLAEHTEDMVNQATEVFEQLDEKVTVFITETETIIADGHAIIDRCTTAAEATEATNEAVQTAEALRITAETGRVTAENQRVESENARAAEEEARALAETSRVDAETSRVAAEVSRVQAEADRVKAEKAREAAEAARELSEEARKTTESLRVSAEIYRAQEEITRSENEALRQEQEAKRQTDTAAAVEAANTAADNADQAAERANTAAKVAEDMVDGFGFIPLTQKGEPEGVATLDDTGKVPKDQLPKTGTGIYLSPTVPEGMELNEHWYEVI
ncbi:BppU family phage baseplate upper protein [Anaerolentibacter hominis]|uniref:BppU family phage baseplate upper protein n=1 Tax=Anaerolentibacter hominis TaxID=3079009 RepID=UPI0031B873B4